MKQKVIKKLREQLSKVNYKCKEWCFECCTVVPVYPDELKAIKIELLKKWYKEPPNWKGDWYCEFLTSEGKCSVYNQRPIICRSFSNIKYILKRWNRQVPTQSCTYWDWKEETATPEFIKYWLEVLEKWIVIGSKELLEQLTNK